MWLKHCYLHHSQSNLAFVLTVWVCLNKTFVPTLCFLIIYFIGIQGKKKEHVGFTSYCRFYSNGRGVLIRSPVQLKHAHGCWWHVSSSPWAQCPWVRLWILNLHCCSTHPSLCALLQLLGTVYQPSSSLPSCQALAVTTIGSDTLPMATSNLFKHWKLNVSQEGTPGWQPSPPSFTRQK